MNEVGGGPGEHGSGGTGVLTCGSSPHTPLSNPLYRVFFFLFSVFG